MRATARVAGSGGFTLIELMITVAIVGILAAVAYPSYVEHVRKSRRADCKAVMLTVMNALERRFSLESAYPDEESEPDPLAGFSCPPDGGAASYTLELDVPAGGASFTLTATPTAAQASDSCGTLTLTNTGARSASGTGSCW